MARSGRAQVVLNCPHPMNKIQTMQERSTTKGASKMILCPAAELEKTR